MTRNYSLEFSTPPSPWATYPRILASRKPSLAREAAPAVRIEATQRTVRVDAAHLARYREICGCGGDPQRLPIAYPHVLAGALHLAMLSCDAFPVKLLGLVHVRNRIEQRHPIDPSQRGSLHAFVDGHRETDRGQEFDLQTQWLVDGEATWSEVTTFLARRPRGTGTARSDDAAAPRGREAGDARAVTSASFRAPAGLGRSYGLVSGDVNPIHLADITARAFGFKAAIAHGMWSLARCAAELDAAMPADAARVLEVAFKLPVLLPAWVLLQSWPVAGGVGFALRDSQGERPHLEGSLTAAA